MARCRICGRTDPPVSAAVGVCVECLRAGKDEAVEIAQQRRRELRRSFGLPEQVPRAREGTVCDRCANACRLTEGALGYCGVRVGTERGIEAFPKASAAAVEWYLDPLPTNCVAAWACAATGAGYPRYSRSPRGETGYFNLAVFYNGCNFDCLFCQNWHHRYRRARPRTAEELAQAATLGQVACICFFGGDPTPHADHALAAARRALELHTGPLRVCWETNGAMSPRVLDQIIELAMATGGTVKFDLKAWSEPVHVALCGVSNQATLRNFRRLAEAAAERDEPPLAAASTLLVPGYVDVQEVQRIAEFIAEINPRVPYSLLAFHPDYAMDDLPPTTRRQAEECYRAAVEAGLERVRIGNVHLLW